ncbi:hypothetical protein [Novosphingobium sp. KA1]|uniref:hypothetical protein n=1 Tax=Novosphingobium sp. (strain KA1) TaxID=164608 RepID=UPI001A8FCBB6|nr:hypothetical protein [Novosphingobium sp. KA1]QSR16585.1 hypothetical protein CA833_05200 [Novosphingobium sp. KA1]
MTPLSAPTASGAATASLGTRAGPAPESGGFAAILGGAEAGLQAIAGGIGSGSSIGSGKPTGKDLPVLPAKAAANDVTKAQGEEPGTRESGAVQDIPRLEPLAPEPLAADPMAPDPSPLAAAIAALALVPNLAATAASAAPQGSDARAISPSAEPRPVPALAVPALPAAVPAGTPLSSDPALAPATGERAPVAPKAVALAAIELVPVDAAADDPAPANPAPANPAPPNPANRNPTAAPDSPDETALPTDKAPVAAGGLAMNARIVPALRPSPLAGQDFGSTGSSTGTSIGAHPAPATLSLATDPAAPTAGGTGTPALAPPPDSSARLAEARRSASYPSGNSSADPLADQPALPAAPVTLAQSAPDTVAIGASGSSAAAPPTSAFTPPASGTGETTQGPQDFATLVSKLGEAREAASPHLVRTAITHGEFGPISLQFRHEGGALSVTMANADPAFASAVQTGLAATLAAGAGNGALADGSGNGSGEARQAWQQASASHSGPGATGSFGADSRQNQDRTAAQSGARDEERARQGSAATIVQASGEASGSTRPPAAGPGPGPGRSGIYA